MLLPLAAAILTPYPGAVQEPPPDPGLVAVPGIEVGHQEPGGRPTGCTVVLARGGAVAGVDVRGSAPGTRETDLLDPVNTVERVHAIVLSGGSAFGLAAADGAVRFLAEAGIGFPVGPFRVPIVPAAILFDLGVQGPGAVPPGADCGYRAAAAAASDPVRRGNAGAGAGATVGKIRGMARAMKGGIGSASLRFPDGLVVAALVAVNAVGDVVDPASGAVVAGVRGADGGLADARRLLLDPDAGGGPGGGAGGGFGGAPVAASTTIGVVATGAPLTKAQATKVAQMAHDGLARTIYPAHTPSDGDTLFALSTGGGPEAGVGRIGALAAEVVARAVLDAVRSAESLPGLPAARDLPPVERNGRSPPRGGFAPADSRRPPSVPAAPEFSEAPDSPEAPASPEAPRRR